MSALSRTPQEIARKGAALAFQAFSVPGKGGAVAAAMGLSDTSISRIKTERMEEVALLCAHLGIKWVPADHKCVAPETYEFLTRTHARVMQQAPELIWDTTDE